MRNLLRAAAALAALGAVALVLPQSALACSGPMPTREEAVEAATVILAGRVESRPAEWAYQLEVEEVFRGPQRDTIVIGDVAPATTPICSHQLEVGDRVVIALRDPTDLGLFSSAVWYLLADGTVGTMAPEPPAATHDELFAYLRLIPDTSMSTRHSLASLLEVLGVLLLGSSLGFAVVRPFSGGARSAHRL